MHQPSHSSRAVTLLTGVFALMAVLGALGTWKGVEFLFSEEPMTAVGPLLTGPVFLIVGIAVPMLMRRVRAGADARARVKIAHPQKPWAWRKDWLSGRIAGEGRKAALAIWLFALVWNAFTWPAAWLFLNQSVDDRVYIVLVFPAIGLLLLALAVQGSLRHRKYGRSHLVLQTNPGVIGRTLEGRIETALQTAPDAGVEVRLSCIRRYTTGTGEHQRTDQTTVWKDHVTVPPADLGRGLKGLTIPLAFGIPSNARPYDDNDPHDQIVWRLDVSAATPGVDYTDSFDVPVFDTGAEPLSASERGALTARRLTHAKTAPPADPIIRVSHTPRGGTTFSGKPRTTVVSMLGMVGMTAGAWIATWYLFANRIPLAPYFVAFFAVLFTAGSVVALFHRSSVTVDDGRVVIRHRILGLGPTRHVSAGEIVDVRSEVVGEGNAQSWEVKIHTSGGAAYSAAAHLPTQSEADWTADQIHAAIKAVQRNANTR